MAVGRPKRKEILVVELYSKRWSKEDLNLHDLLYKLYVTDGKSMEEVAKDLYMSKSYVSKLLRQEGIPVRTLKWTF